MRAQKQSIDTGQVLFVSQSGSLGGAELCLLELLERSPGRCRVLLFSDGPLVERAQNFGVPVEVVEDAHFPSNSRRATFSEVGEAVHSVRRLAKYVASRAETVDCVYANSQKAFTISSLALLRRRIPLIWHMHDIMSAEHFSYLSRMTNLSLGALRASRVIVPSLASARPLLKVPMLGERVSVIPNGIDPERFSPLMGFDKRCHWRTKLGIASDAFVVGCFSRLAAWKGQHVLLRALREMPDIEIVLVGAPLFEEDTYLEELRDIVNRDVLNARVHMLGFQDDIAGLMVMCDLVVHLSISPEPFGRVLVEAMMSGVPLICTRGGGADEIVDPEVALSIEPNDHLELAKAIKSVIFDYDRALRRANRAAKKANASYALSMYQEAVWNCIDEALIDRVWGAS